MKFADIREVPVNTDDILNGNGEKQFKDIRIHESCLRSYHILDKVTQLLADTLLRLEHINTTALLWQRLTATSIAPTD